MQKRFGKQGEVVFNSDFANLGRKGGASFFAPVYPDVL